MNDQPNDLPNAKKRMRCPFLARTHSFFRSGTKNVTGALRAPSSIRGTLATLMIFPNENICSNSTKKFHISKRHCNSCCKEAFIVRPSNSNDWSDETRSLKIKMMLGLSPSVQKNTNENSMIAIYINM